MGKPDTVMRNYLTDKRRFADLFNGVFFQGKQVIHSEDLQEASERYSDPKGTASNRYRDVKMFLKEGAAFRILAVENQQHIDYTMPYRCMQYDVMEYGKQLRDLKNYNKEQGLLKSPAEKMCGITGKDRLCPVYTLCLYHGEELWDGPQSLKDMMDFGMYRDGFSAFFADYPLRLFCVNGAESFEMFHTELRELFGALKFRRNKAGLLQLLKEDESYAHLSAETMTVLLNVPSLWNRWEEMQKVKREGDEYNMCQALLELQEESKAEGRALGIAQGSLEKTKTFIKNMLKRGFSDEDICALAECSVEMIDGLRQHLGRL